MFKIFLVFSILGAAFGAPNYHNFSIVGGHDSSIAKHPSIVSLHHGNDFVCGGTLIASRYVLTAAHCITRFKSGLYIRAGSTYISDGGQVENVMDYTIYPGHSDKTYVFDIAILHLTGPVSVKTAQNARLPSAGQAVPDNAQVVVVGWGAQSENGKKLATVLQEVTIPVMNLKECAGYNSKINPVTKDNFCAGVHAGGIDSCQGDSGGPAILNGVLVGIISWGNGCARPNSPGVYTLVSNFRKFISDYAHV